MAMKRSRDLDLDLERSIAIANYLLMLSNTQTSVTTSDNTSKVFECKTCNRQFPSFQALGGHRASHKKPRLSPSSCSSSSSSDLDPDRMVEKGVVMKAKTHECTICGLEFGVGQALGGHMRRHRANLNGSRYLPRELIYSSKKINLSEESTPPIAPFVRLPLLSNCNTNYKGDDYDYKGVTKNDNYGRSEKTMISSLDLNLTPLENGLLI